MGDLTEVRGGIWPRGRGWRSGGLDHSVVYGFQLLIFRPVPWLHSAVASPVKSELLRGLGTHQHASQWHPSPCSPFRQWDSLCPAQPYSISFLFSRNLLKLISVSLFTLHLFRLYFLTCSLDCHYFLFLYSFVNFNTCIDLCNHLRIQSNTTTPVSFLLYSFIVTLSSTHDPRQPLIFFPPPLFCLLRCHKCIHM